MENRKMKSQKLSSSMWKSFIISMTIAAVWYGTEYMQFGELQWNRDCDNIVGFLYWIALTYAFYKKEDAD